MKSLEVKYEMDSFPRNCINVSDFIICEINLNTNINYTQRQYLPDVDTLEGRFSIPPIELETMSKSR